MSNEEIRDEGQSGEDGIGGRAKGDPSQPENNSNSILEVNCQYCNYFSILQSVRKLVSYLCFEISLSYVDVLQNPFNPL